MTTLAPLLEAFFTERLLRQRCASPHTVAAYRDTFRLLLRFAQQRLAKPPSQLLLDDVDVALVSAFLDYLEAERHDSIRTRNARLAAIRSFFRYISILEPAHGALIQRVLALPQKRFERNLVTFLTPSETEALLAVPDQQIWLGRRDHALLLLAVTTGLRAWLRERRGLEGGALFPSLRNQPLSSDAVQKLVAKYASAAGKKCPSLNTKRITPHVPRHTAAVRLLQAGVDRSVIALWLGHEQIDTTQMYLAADLSMKERALARTSSLPARLLRYRPNDELLAFLQGL